MSSKIENNIKATSISCNKKSVDQDQACVQYCYGIMLKMLVITDLQQHTLLIIMGTM